GGAGGGRRPGRRGRRHRLGVPGGGITAPGPSPGGPLSRPRTPLDVARVPTGSPQTGWPARPTSVGAPPRVLRRSGGTPESHAAVQGREWISLSRALALAPRVLAISAGGCFLSSAGWIAPVISLDQVEKSSVTWKECM